MRDSACTQFFQILALTHVGSGQDEFISKLMEILGPMYESKDSQEGALTPFLIDLRDCFWERNYIAEVFDSIFAFGLGRVDILSMWVNDAYGNALRQQALGDPDLLLRADAWFEEAREGACNHS